MELDITTLEHTYLFLEGLNAQGFISYNLSFKIVSKLTDKVSYINYKDINSFISKYSGIVNDQKPNRYCMVGDFIYIENIKFINTAVSYKNEIFFYNVANGSPRSKINIEYNNYKNAFLSSDSAKFTVYLKELLINYFNQNYLLQKTRQDAYVDACYVDPNYTGSLGYKPTNSVTDTSGLE